MARQVITRPLKIQDAGSPIPSPPPFFLGTRRPVFLSSSLQPHMLIHASQHSCPTIGVIASHYVVMATPTAIWGAGRWQGKQMSGQSGFPGKCHNDTLLSAKCRSHARTAGWRTEALVTGTGRVALCGDRGTPNRVNACLLMDGWLTSVGRETQMVDSNEKSKSPFDVVTVIPMKTRS